MKLLPPVEFAYRPLLRWVARTTAWALCLAPLALTGWAQSMPGTGQPKPSLQQPIGQRVSGFEDLPGADPAEEEKRLRALNADRQKSMVSDTNKLLRLVAELNADIERSNPDSLTPDQLRKVAQIEKLAHSVKEKMSTSVRGVPSFLPPPQRAP